jgi:hypothetical protein
MPALAANRVDENRLFRLYRVFFADDAKGPRSAAFSGAPALLGGEDAPASVTKFTSSAGNLQITACARKNAGL